MPVVEEPSDDFDILREQHERLLEDLVLNDEDDDEQIGGNQQQWADGTTDGRKGQGQVPANSNILNAQQQASFSFNDMASSMSPPSASSVSGASLSWTDSSTAPRAASSHAAQQQEQQRKSKVVLDLSIKPQFNLENASKLLASFRYMLPGMPLLILPEDVNVRSLAKNAPFVLLAILAVTSCSTNLQGHSLYDEEFRKVFGLKFVAGGERSLELLQGLLVYCSW
jgi:hypothetical protein